MHDRELDIASARRKVENQVIEFAPFDLPQKLLGVTRHHRSAQNSRRGVVEQKSHRHQTQAVLLDRNDLVFFRCHWSVSGAEHERNAWAIDIAVTQPDARLGLLERDREVCRDGLLTNTSLAARNRDGVLESRN